MCWSFKRGYQTLEKIIILYNINVTLPTEIVFACTLPKSNSTKAMLLICSVTPVTSEEKGKIPF